MSQQEVINFLKKNSGTKYTAEELQNFLGLGQGLYSNLQKLRPKCRLGHPVMGNVKRCGFCSQKVESQGVRCVLGIHIGDSREDTRFYWWQG